MQSDAPTVDEYIAGLPEERRQAISAVRRVIKENLPEGYEEMMDFGMIGYGIPLERYPDTYNGHPLPYVALASQKNYMSLYLLGVYSDEETARWFHERWAKTGKKLDMGKSCVRFKKVEDLPLDLIGETIARMTPDELIRRYESSKRGSAARKRR